MPWEFDKLNSRATADYLTQYLTGKYSVSKDAGPYPSFVLNINAEWGFGKTYLLQNWHAALRTKYPTIYFNAWDNDYSEDPLIGFISEIDTQLTPFFSDSSQASKYLKSAVSRAKQLLRPTIPILLSILAKKATGLSAEEL